MKSSRMWFKTDEGDRQDDVKRRAQTVLRSFAYASDGAEPGIDGPLWAFPIICSREGLKATCLWFRAARAYTEDEDARRVLCIEAWRKIEQALRAYL